MIPFRKILVPLDFSEPSKRALDYALAFATRFNAKLVVTHVIPEISTLSYAFPIENLAIEINQRERAVQEIRTLIPDQRSKLVDLHTIVRVGRVEDSLLQIMDEERVDLVIMGSHGRRNFRRWFLGSITEHILRKVPVPILTVSHIEEARYPFGGGVTSFKRLLYATDLGESAATGLEYATELAHQFSAELTVMNVVEYLNVSYEAAAYLGNERAERLQTTQRQLDAFVNRQNPHNLHLKTIVVEGKAYERILATAEEMNADCIVMNLQSKGLLERAFLGSTAERVVRLATIPVLSIPADVSKSERMVD
ncbi:MAG TPA: universal stress protein [Terriglobia bacterium]|nr:universal stress protein [Terriglobia bacterium]